jgi:HEAT repeat protein
MARRLAVTVCFACCALLTSGYAAAQKAKPPAAASKPATIPKADLDRLKQALVAGSEAERIAALDELGRLTGPSAALAAPAVNELLGRGASVAVLLRALEVAGKLAQPASSTAVAPYARHRMSEVRVAATRALSGTGGAEAVSALRATLRGGDRASRGFAASGLATLKAKDAVPDLFAVLAKDVPEAAGAIGDLCLGADCSKFVALLGKFPFDLMQTGLAPILLRPETEVPAEFKLEVLERLRKLQTDEAHAFLETLRASYPEKGNSWVKYGLDQAVGNKPVLPPPGQKGKAKP